MYGKKFLRQWLWHSLVKLRTKNYENPWIFVKVTAKKSVAPFFWTRYSFPYQTLWMYCDGNPCITIEATYWQTRCNARPLCGSRATCFTKIILGLHRRLLFYEFTDITVMFLSRDSIPMGTSNGGVQCRWSRHRDSEPISGFMLSTLRPARYYQHSAAGPWQVVTLIAGSKRRSLLMTGDDDEMFTTRSLNVTPNWQQNSI